jgi:hypothetical protein
VQARVRDCNGKWASFECRCPLLISKKEEDFIEFNELVRLGEFDQKVNFDVEIKNISRKI